MRQKKVTNIKRSKKWDEITCTIYTEWESTDNDGKKVIELIPDELTLCDPFKYGEEALHVQFQLKSSDYIQLKQFCIAKSILPDWVRNNPYIKKENETMGSEHICVNDKFENDKKGKN